MIAVDTPVLIELLTDGPRADAVEACLRQCLGNGRVVLCDASLAELCSALRNGADALAALEEMGVHFSAVEAKSALRAGEMSVSELKESTQLAQANVSKHLSVLHRIGYVERRRDGAFAYYRMSATDVFKVCDLMCDRLVNEAERWSQLATSARH